MKKIWHGETTCNICNQEIKKGRLYDAKTVHGQWAVMCHNCYVKYGVGVGTGLGQRYEYNKTTKEFEKKRG